MNRLTLMLLIVVALVSGLMGGAWFFDGVDPKVISQLERRLTETKDELQAAQETQQDAMFELGRRPTTEAMVQAEAALTRAEQALARTRAELTDQNTATEDRVQQLTEQLNALKAIDVDALLAAAQAEADDQIQALQTAAADQLSQMQVDTAERIAQANKQAADRVAQLNREARDAMTMMVSEKDSVIGQLMERLLTTEANISRRWSSTIEEKDRLIAQLNQQLDIAQANTRDLQRQLNEMTVEADGLAQRLRAAQSVIEQLKATPPIEILINDDGALSADPNGLNLER